jgi:hypothetical protein
VNNVLRIVKGWLRVLLTPGCWFQNKPYSSAWDRKLRELLRDHDFTHIDQYTAQLGPYIIWISNHPYASMTLYQRGMGRPRRITILEAGDKFEQDLLKELSI